MFLENASRKGYIEVICGSMFSGKTEELIRRLKRAKFANQRVEIFKPKLDVRYSEEDVVSHDSNAIRSTPVDSSGNILLMAADVDVVGIDEAQFFDQNLVDVCRQLADNGVRVIVAGLDMDDRMETALAKVENVMSSHSFKYAQYANITGNAPAVAIEENGAIAACDKSNEEAYENVTVTEDHAIAALGMMLTEVRGTENGLELHYVDALPYPLNMAFVALVKGLIYNVDNLNALQEFATGITVENRENLRPSAKEKGLNAAYMEGTLREIAKDLYFMATPQLPEEEQHYTQPLDAIIFREICPKDVTKRQLKAMQA